MGSHSRIALDTNIILYSIEKKVDLFDELTKSFGLCEIFVPQSVINEIRKIAKSKGAETSVAKRAKIAVKILEHKNIKVVMLSKNADKDLARLSKKGFLVATHDQRLKKLIKSYGGKVIYLRNKKIFGSDVCV
ncbi:MAG: PIN domain-containing protein [Candidatus Diapherotrites archaeon]|nr:PIN domain-containing protein [Candidatus Diapherotrites archaeon]